jgi:putative hydrolase of the HAD superfamily
MTQPALLCDYGGVLTTSLYTAAAAASDVLGIDHEAFRAELRRLREKDDPVARVERGELDRADFTAAFAPLLAQASGDVVAGEEFLRQLSVHIQPEPRMLDMVASLRGAGFPCALVSNSWTLEDYPNVVLDLFDVTVLSGAIGVRKPEPAIYELAVERLGVTHRSCVFVDDLAVNVETARQLGMTGILHDDVEVTLRRIGELFDLELG